MATRRAAVEKARARLVAVTVPLVFALATPAVAAPPEPVAEPVAEPVTEPAAEPAAQPQAVPLPAYDSEPQPIPPPSLRKPDPNRGLGLMIPGLAIFVASFGVSLLSGIVAIDWNNKKVGRPLLLPVAGPFIALARTDSQAQLGMFAALGACQVIGLGMAIGGGVWWHRERRARAQLSFAPTGLQIRF